MLPKYLIQTVLDKATSLGDHPALPPDEEVPYLLELVKETYSHIMDEMHYRDNVSVQDLKDEFEKLKTECKKHEEPVKEALHKICCDILSEIFDIPDDTVDIDVMLVDNCDMDKYRMTPEPVDDFQFEDMDDMNDLSDRIYQRRMVDALVCGAAMRYAYNVNRYDNTLSEIDPALPDLYRSLIRHRLAILFMTEDTVSSVDKQCDGVVDVVIPNEGDQIVMRAEATVFPFLLEQAVKGIFEIAAIRGLPKDQERAEYIIKKADYRLAENWDARIGGGLWDRLCGTFSKCGCDIDSIKPNFIVMEIASMKPDIFNVFMQNALKRTKKGLAMAKSLGNAIEYNKEADDFNNFVKDKNRKYPINDEEYTSAELLAEIGDQI